MKKITLPLMLFILQTFFSTFTNAQNVKTIGTSGDYETLHEAFTAVRNGGVTGEIIFKIISDITETSASEILASGEESFNYSTITIMPTGASRTISASFNDPIITIDAGDYITFDGRVDGVGDEIQLTLKNSGGIVFHFKNDASNNIVQYCSIKGNNTDAAKGLVTFTAGAAGCTNTLIENCSIGDAILYTVNGIYAEGTGEGINSGFSISACNIFNFWSNTSSSCGIYLDNHNSDWHIMGNKLYQTNSITATGANQHFGIYSLSGFVDVMYNRIGGSETFCGGAPWTVTGPHHLTFTGIFVDNENTQQSTIIGNSIMNFDWQPQLTADAVNIPGVWCGIRYTGGNITISSNNIGSETGTNSILVTSSGDFNATTYGIAGGITDANFTISGNKIGSINVSSSNPDYSHSFVGIQNNGATELIISNNTIGSSATAQSIQTATACTNTSVGQKLIGIINNANTTICQITGNTIANLYNSTEGMAGSSQAHQTAGIIASNGANSITGNTIKYLTTTSQASGTEKNETVIGICLSSDKPNQTISQNTILNLLNSNPSSGVYMSGILYNGSTEGTNNVIGNTIAGLNITSTGISDIKGITIFSGCANYVNNMISLGNAVTRGHYIQGILKWTNATGTSNFYHNSIVVSGTVSGSTDIQTFAFRQNWATPTDVVKNNIFINTRVTSSGAGKNYALFKNNTDNITLDYNCYYVNGTGTVLGFDGTSDKTELPIITGQDANSLIAEVAFTNTATADLHTSSAAVNATATPITGITTDFDGNTRNPQFPDIGADEFSLPTIRVNPSSLANFGLFNVREASDPQSYEITGIDLSSNLAVAAPTNYEVSLTSDSDFGASVSFIPTNTNVVETVYARFAPQESGFHLASLANSSTGATPTSVSVAGTALGVLPLVSSSDATTLTTTTAVGNGKIDHTGGDNATTRGIIVWPYTGTNLEIGGENVVNFSENGSFSAGTFYLNITGLLVNTRYNFRSYAINPQGTAYGETMSFWTLANIPDAPTATGVTGSTVNLSINENLNPASTQFAIYETTKNRYIQSDGSMETNPVWQTKTQWGTKTVTLYDLQNRTGNRQYIFKIMARNGVGTQTALGETTSILTLANTPNIMWVGSPTSSTLSVAVYTYLTDYSNNSNETPYAIEEINTGKFLQTNGTLAADTAWNTRNNWDVKIVSGLSIASEYIFRSIATNDDGIRTSPGPENGLFTLAVVPGAPTISNVAETTAKITVNPAENPNNVEYAVVVNSGSFVQSNGTIAASPAWQTKTSWDDAEVKGLSPNAIYSFNVKARNGDELETIAGEGTTITTLANVPLPPELYVYSYTDRLIYYIFLSGNPEITEFAIQDSITGKYLHGDGYLSETAEWRTKNGWQGATQLILGLLPGTEYAIRVKARNSSNIETGWGLSAKLSTLPNVPGIPIISSITPSSVDFEINPNDNPDCVTFAVIDNISSLYVQEDASFSANPFWQNETAWGKTTISGLSPNQNLSLKVKARNVDEAETNFCEPFSFYTYAITPAAPIVEVLSTTNVSINVNPNGNPNTVYYAIQEVTTGQYINFYNGLWFEEDWRTDEFWDKFDLGGLTQNTEYSFRVKARNSDYVETGFGPISNITTLDGPPVAPTLASPQHGSENLPNSIIFTWYKLDIADTYSIQIASYEGFQYLVFEQTGISDTTLQVDNLYHGEVHYWRVNASNSYGAGPWSGAWLFSTMPGHGAIPSLLTPENGAQNVPAETVMLSWGLPHGATGFSVQVSDDDEFGYFIVDTVYNIGSYEDIQRLFINNLELNTTYYWRVNTLNSYGASPWSEVWSFTTTDGTVVPGINTPTITIFPNPAKENLYIKGTENTNVKVSIISGAGLKVLEQTLVNNTLRLHSLKPGVYIIKIETHEWVVVRKFIKQ